MNINISFIKNKKGHGLWVVLIRPNSRVSITLIIRIIQGHFWLNLKLFLPLLFPKNLKMVIMTLLTLPLVG